MDTRHATLTLLVSLNFMLSRCMDNEIVSVEEGSTATLTCSGYANKSVRYVAWATIGANGSRTPMTCFSTDETCSRENTCQADVPCTARTNINKHVFNSQLDMHNVTADLRRAVIECIIDDTLYKDDDDIFIMRTFGLKLFRLPERATCRATKDVHNAVNISCEFVKVYPRTFCRMFPELEKGAPVPQQGGNDASLLELSKVECLEIRFAGPIEYFSVYCTTKYFPTQNGNFRFRIEMYFTDDLVTSAFNISTNVVAVDWKSGHLNNACNERCNGVDTEAAFYTLMGSVLMFGLTVFIILSWLVWMRRGRSAPNVTSQENDYAYINDTSDKREHVSQHDEGYGESSGGGTNLSELSNEGSSQLPSRLDERGYVSNVAAPRPHALALNRLSSRSDISYIIPTTPTSTLSKSPEKRTSLDTSLHEEKDNKTQPKLV